MQSIMIIPYLSRVRYRNRVPVELTSFRLHTILFTTRTTYLFPPPPLPPSHLILPPHPTTIFLHGGSLDRALAPRPLARCPCTLSALVIVFANS